MLNLHLGGKVGFHPEEMVEIGYYPLSATELGQAPRAPRPIMSTSGIAKAANCRPVRAACHIRGRVPRDRPSSYGPAAVRFQFHPEITYAQVHRWTGHNPQRLA